MINFEIIRFLKFGNVDIFLRLSSREFHSQMANGIHDFCEILVRFRGLEVQVYFYCFSNVPQHY